MKIQGKLAPCPGRPNCVSSLSRDESHFVPALAIGTNPKEAMKQLRAVVEAMPGASVIDQDSHYLHALFTSRVFRFADDVEFSLDEDEGVIHVRSASRAGYWDLGVNRKRVEEIRARFQILLP